MTRCGRWITLACSILFLFFGRPAEAQLNCEDIVGGYWHNDKSVATEMAKARWEKCAYKQFGRPIKFESSQGPHVTCEPMGPFVAVPENDCKFGYGPNRGARYLCKVNGGVCRRN
jgi:hypothetical protein